MRRFQGRGFPAQRLKVSGAGRPTSVGSYATGITYAPNGSPSGLTMGNGIGESVSIDPRLRPHTIAAAKGGVQLLSVTNGYAASGNVSSQQLSISVSGGSAGYGQTFGYDNVNRLIGASETNAGAGTASWSQVYGFDAYGNRAVTSSTFPLSISTPVSTSQYDGATNRIALAPDNSSMPSDAYDAAGNLTDHPKMGQFTYDAEGRMTSASIAGALTSYTYDGEGRRVMTSGPSGTTVFLYDAQGQLLAEYGGLAQGLGTRYLTADAVGSTRMVTDANGNVTSRHDYAPFGEELMPSSNTTVRTTGNGFIGQEPGIRFEFTGQERDQETGFDYFAARHYGSSIGRFMVPDPAGNVVADFSNPQTWNMYSYARNNPLTYVDPSGLDPILPCVNDTDPNTGNICATGTGAPGLAQGGGDNSGGADCFLSFLCGGGQPPSSSTSQTNPSVTANSTLIQQLPPPKTGTCPAGASAAGLTYPPGVQQHIEQLHMIFLPNGQGNNFTYYRRGGVDIPRSQYYFDPSGTAAQNWNLVTQINAQTFSLATPQPSRGNVLFTATLGPQNNPVPGARPYLGIDYSGSFNLFGFKVPVMKSYTSTNTLVTRSDCQTVVSSYPGNP